MVDVHALKGAVQDEVDRIAQQLIECSDWMADNPEIGYQEEQAAAQLAGMLKKYGAEIEPGIADLPTAFCATLPGNHRDGSTIALLAEYDALPTVGHGCGHNIIGNAAIGAGIALARLEEVRQLPGKVMVFGTPAEESAVPNAGGKIWMLEKGCFDGVDTALMIHPLTEDFILGGSMTAYGIDFQFQGKAAHAAANPELGINALDAVIQTFVNIGLLRQQIRAETRIHGIVTDGGSTPNVIPASAACRFRVRSFDLVYAAERKRRVIACAEGAATATGTRLTWSEYAKPYLSCLPNSVLDQVMRTNMVVNGRPVKDRAAHATSVSTDFGNVSHALPATTAMFGICDEEPGWHTKEVAAATKTERGHKALVDAAKTLAMSVLDLLCNPNLVTAARQEREAAMIPIREGLARIARASEH